MTIEHRVSPGIQIVKSELKLESSQKTQLLIISKIRWDRIIIGEKLVRG